MIVNDILQKMNHIYPSVLKGHVGIEENANHIELLLEKVSIIGIWGMGGLGKTTMAKVVFSKLSSQFESCCFLENLREESEKYGLKYIRNKLLRTLLKEEGFAVESPFAIRRLICKRVFIVLDDVSHLNQLEYLAKECHSLEPGSKVIITSRDRHVLNGRVDEIYEAKALSSCHSLKLFNLRAFHKNDYESGYEELSQRAVAYAKGNPLALIILGSFLYSKTTAEWDSALKQLEITTHEDIQAVLKLSYDGLNSEEKKMFLDIACFLKGKNVDQVKALFDSYGFHASIGLRTLVDKALISNNGIVWMHDLIQKMGWKIVRQECIEDPGRRSRLWNPDEIYHVLKNDRGTDTIEGIILDLSQISETNLSTDTLNKMTNLRFLKFYYSSWDRRSSVVNLPSDLESFSNSLRYLRWDNFPLESLPSSCCVEKLVELHMPGSKLKKLWDGVRDLVNLRTINLGASKQLIELPDFSKAQNLERVSLWFCESLCHLHPSILSLQKLSSLHLGDCKNLKSLQSEGHLRSLKHLHVDNCYSLKEFSLSSAKMAILRLQNTAIEILGSSIGRLESLKSLSLNGSRLKNLPMNEFCRLRSLRELCLYDYKEIIDKSKLQILFDALQSLERITLDGSCKLTELPNNIKHLSRLQVLSLRNCKSLQSLPELPPSIQELDATNCTSLKTLLLTSLMEVPLLPEQTTLDLTPHCSIGFLRNLTRLYLSGCEQLYELSEHIGSLSSLHSLKLDGSNVESLPSSIKHLSKLKYIDLTNCRRLRSLPELPPFTKSVVATNCISLETALSITSTMRLEALRLENCLKLEKQSLSHIMRCAYFPLMRGAYMNREVGVCYPGREVPKFVHNHAIGASNLTVEFSATANNLVGFIFYCILPQFTPTGKYFNNLKWIVSYEDGKVDPVMTFHMDITELNSHHVFLWYSPNTFMKDKETLMDDKETNYNRKLSFQFFVKLCFTGPKFEPVPDGLIEACGVCPVYASAYHSFLQQMELESELRTQKMTCHDVGEHSLRGIMEYATFSLKPTKSDNFQRTFIPEWFQYKSLTTEHSTSLSLQLAASDFNSLLGFIFYFVIPQFSSKERDQSRSACKFYVRNGHYRYKSIEGPRGWHYSMRELNSHNVFLWYAPLFCELILLQLEDLRVEYEGTRQYKPEISFEFEFGDCLHVRFSVDQLGERGYKFGDCLIKEYGVRPIYASEYRKFLQQKGLKLERKRQRNIEEKQLQLISKKKWKESSVFQPIPLSSEPNTSQDFYELLFAISQLNLESSKDDQPQK